MSATSQIFAREPIALTDGQAVVVDCRGMAFFNTIAGAGATVTATRVNAKGRNGKPTESGPGLDAAVFPAASSSTYTIVDQTAIAVDWPFVRFKTTGGAASIAVI